MKRAIVPIARLATTSREILNHRPIIVPPLFLPKPVVAHTCNSHCSLTMTWHRPFATTTRNDHQRQVDAEESSSSSTPSAFLLQRTKHLLDPSNKLDPTGHALWIEADQVLRAWLDDDTDNGQETTGVPALKRVECCLRLLDRLASSMPKGEILFASILDTRILHQLLITWRRGLMSSTEDDNDPSSPSSSSSSDEKSSLRRLRRQLTPSFLAGKIDKYRWFSLIQPDVKSFNLLLNTSKLFPFRDGVAFADAFLQKLVQVSQENNETPLMIDSVSVTTVMQAWVQNRQPQKADDWLERIQDWRKNGSDHTYHDGGGLGEVLLPNHIMYTTVLSGWAKVGNAERALQILQMQLDDFQHGNLEAQPDTMTFNVVLDALAKSNDPSAAVEADVILAQMREYSTTLDWNCSPDDHTWTNVLACYAKVKVKKAEKLLRQLEEHGEPLSLVTYNTMLNVYAQAGQASQAVDLLQKLESSSSSNFQPDVTSYNTVLSAFAKSKAQDSALPADALWSRMLEKGISPTTISYGTLLQCWAKSKEPGAADRAEELLREMKRDPSTQPNIVCYNTVLSAWGNQARLSGDSKEVERVLRLFQELVESTTKENEPNLQPTDATFRSVLHAIVGSSVGNKSDLLDSLEPAMEKYSFRPSAGDEKLLRRFAKPSAGRRNHSKRQS